MESVRDLSEEDAENGDRDVNLAGNFKIHTANEQAINNIKLTLCLIN
jgi:hypothetical protein